MKKETNLPIYTQELIHNDFVNIIYNPDIEEHKHCFWEINLIEPHSNKINIINGKKVDSEEGLISLLRPYKDRHLIKTESELLYNHYDMYVFPEQMQRLCSLLDDGLYEDLFNAESTPCFVPNRINIDTIVAEIRIIKKQMLTFPSSAKIRFSSLMAYVLGLFASHIDEKLVPPFWMEKLLRQIDEIDNFSSFSLSDLISSLHYTHGHICREFKKYTKTTLIGYINNIKLEKSIKLLANNLKIIDIANILGYCSQSAFENAFKKRYGISPGNWRKHFRRS